MKDNWLKDIHDRMTDYETDEPRGLWEDICGPTPNPSPKGRGEVTTENDETSIDEVSAPLPLGEGLGKGPLGLLRWVPAAAACIALCWFITKDHPGDVPSTATSGLASTKVAAGESGTASANAKTKVAQKVVRTNQSRENEPFAALTYANQKNNDAPVVMGNEELTPTPDEPYQELSNTTSAASPTITDTTLSTQPSTEHQATRTPQQHGHKLSTGSTVSSRFHLALAHSGGANANHRQAFHTGYVGEAATLSDADARWMDSPLLGLMALSRGTETERKVKHHAPIRTGLSITYRLTDRWSLESGLSYVTLASDTQEGSSANYLHGHQRLHYIGIPLGASFRVFSWKRLDLYLTANALAEKCVKGTLDETFVIADEVLTDTKETLEDRPLQWAVGVKAGVQYNVTSAFSLYAEPACNYYFDDGSSLETIYKDHPVQASLNLGLRFSLGKQK